MARARKKVWSFLFLSCWRCLEATQPPRYISMIDRVFNPNGFGLQSFSQRYPSDEEVRVFQQWIQKATEDDKTLQLILGDRGSDRFLSEPFLKVAQAVLFVDSSLEPQDPYSQLPRSFGFCSACSDFISFLCQERELWTTLKGRISVVFDDWSLLPYEKHNYGCGTDPFALLSWVSKLSFLNPLLTPSGRIFTSTNFITEKYLLQTQDVFSYKVCRLNVRKQPELAITAPQLTDSRYYMDIPQWVLSPRGLAIHASHTAGHLAASEGLAQALQSVNWKQDLIDFYFADGKFGDRFMVYERLDSLDPTPSAS